MPCANLWGARSRNFANPSRIAHVRKFRHYQDQSKIPSNSKISNSRPREDRPPGGGGGGGRFDGPRREFRGGGGGGGRDDRRGGGGGGGGGRRDFGRR